MKRHRLNIETQKEDDPVDLADLGFEAIMHGHSQVIAA